MIAVAAIIATYSALRPSLPPSLPSPPSLPPSRHCHHHCRRHCQSCVHVCAFVPTYVRTHLYTYAFVYECAFRVAWSAMPHHAAWSWSPLACVFYAQCYAMLLFATPLCHDLPRCADCDMYAMSLYPLPYYAMSYLARPRQCHDMLPVVVPSLCKAPC